ncbi:porin [Vibrio hippocampi]|uniref:Porin domain-containing protein n=1 Tax=Vibrio hippocampi TaxID=654686 RepID=A0ABN8DIP8_9VIBR|nr:porin [Vibrio hippocampi]CAH0526445.1 hypothetical protein VHP8226_01809 [Vibrio hippocampi]
MNKKLLAVIVPCLLVANAQALEIYKTKDGVVDFYGQLRTEIEKAEDKDVTLGAGSSRAGVKAQYDVNEDFYVHGLYEFGLEGDGWGESLTSRLHYAGFGGDWGKVSLGQQWTLQEDMYGADFSYFFGGTAIRYTPISDSKHSSLVKYDYTADTYSFHASYGLDEDNSQPELFELFGTAVFGDFDVVLGLAGEQAQGLVSELETTAYTTSLGYTFDKVYLQGTYYRAEMDFSNALSKTKVTEDAFALAATYDWQDNATAYAGFEYVKNNAAKLTGGEDDGTLIYVGTDYHFNDWSRIYVEFGYGDGTTLGYTNKDSGVSIEPKTVDSQTMYAVGYRVYW